MVSDEEIKSTIKTPDKTMKCNNCGITFYVKKFRGKGELIVMSEDKSENMADVKCFGWLQDMFYPSTN